MKKIFEALKFIQNSMSEHYDNEEVFAEKLISEVCNNFSFPKEKAKRYVALFILKEKEGKLLAQNKTGQRTWSDYEKMIILEYMKDTEKFKSKNAALNEVSTLINRTFTSTQFAYYNLLKNKNEVNEIKTKFNLTLTNQNVEVTEDKDGLYYLENIISNYKKIGEGKFEIFLREIYHMTSLATTNVTSKEEVERLNSLMNEKDDHIQRLEEQLSILSNKYNDLRDIVEKFSSLTSLDKLSNLRMYNDELKNAMENFDETINKGSA